jgi:hypothetical protein
MVTKEFYDFSTGRKSPPGVDYDALVESILNHPNSKASQMDMPTPRPVTPELAAEVARLLGTSSPGKKQWPDENELIRRTISKVNQFQKNNISQRSVNHG